MVIPAFNEDAEKIMPSQNTENMQQARISKTQDCGLAPVGKSDFRKHHRRL
jgi:hypothetical protein